MKKTLVVIMLLAVAIAQAQSKFSTGIETLQLGDSVLHIKTLCSGYQQHIRFIHVHENEKTAVQAATTMLEKYQAGCFTTWQANDDRYVSFRLNDTVYKFDPNRIFSPKGIKETLTTNGPYSAGADSVVSEIAALFLTNYVKQNLLLIALHNNTDGGGLTINSYKKGGAYASDAKKVFINKKRDEDDFILTTNHQLYDAIRRKGFNVVLQDNVRVTDDGSLSVYAGKKNQAYINIEAQHGHLIEQLEMMDFVQQIIAAIKTEVRYSDKLH